MRKFDFNISRNLDNGSMVTNRFLYQELRETLLLREGARPASSLSLLPGGDDTLYCFEKSLFRLVSLTLQS